MKGDLICMLIVLSVSQARETALAPAVETARIISMLALWRWGVPSAFSLHLQALCSWPANPLHVSNRQLQIRPLLDRFSHLLKVIQQINRIERKITEISDSQIYAHFIRSGCSQQQHVWNTKVIYTILPLWSQIALKCHNQISLNVLSSSVSNNL